MSFCTRFYRIFGSNTFFLGRGRVPIIAVLLLMVGVGCENFQEVPLRKIQKIHKNTFTLDAHSASAINFTMGNFDPGKENDFGCFDFPRMGQGGLDASFITVFAGRGKRNEQGYAVTSSRILNTVELIKKGIGDNQEMVELAVSPSETYRINRQGKGAILLGIESGLAIKSVEDIGQYYGMGVRYMTLCLTTNSDLCDSSTDPKGAEHNGLSALGTEVVAEMNRLGMIIDASNASDKAFHEISTVSKTPIIVSHTACRALCSNQRNVSDEMLLDLKANGGVVNITLLSQLLKSPSSSPELDAKLAELTALYGNQLTNASDSIKEKYNREVEQLNRQYREIATVSDFVDHIEHVIQVIGIDHVGISTDFDGGGEVEGCRNVTEIANITAELYNRGYSKSEIEKIWGGNFMRVFQIVSNTAQEE